MKNKEKAISIGESNLDRCFGTKRDYGVTCALEMAQWKDEQFLKLWHISDNEQPDSSRAVLIYDNAEGYAVGCYSSIRPNHQWAYIDELLPPVSLNENLSLDKEYKIKGWVARDQIEGKCGTSLYLGYKKPRRLGEQPFVIWCDYEDCISLPEEMFPDLSFDDEPIEVELTIKKI